MTRGTRLALIGLVVVVAVVGFVIAKSGGSDNKKTTATTSTTNGVTVKGSTPQNVPVQIVVKNGKPAGGVKKIQVNKGDPVRFPVTSDVADEIHVPGYDFHKDVKKGGSVSFDFPARIDGVFVIELESRGEQTAALRAEPGGRVQRRSSAPPPASRSRRWRREWRARTASSAERTSQS